MPRCIALLRGVNVGKANRLAMADFKALLEGVGATGVRTLLASGNAVFDAPAAGMATLAQRIAEALDARCGIRTPVIVKTAAQLDSIVRDPPFLPPDDAHARCFVAFGQDAEALQAIAPLAAQASPGERFVITADAAWLYCPGPVLESRLAGALMGKAAKGLTTRNWATVLKLHALAGTP
jgi:uncharacterized protein (DUF1697 family)